MPRREWTVNAPIKKVDDEQRLVFGWLSVANDAHGVPVVDSDNEVISIEDLAKAAYEYITDSRTVGLMHSVMGAGDMVESCVFDGPKRKAMGIDEGTLPDGWWYGVRVNNDEVWAAVKSGTLRGFSFGGFAESVQVGKSATKYREDGPHEETHQLVNITVVEGSLVDRPANPLATIALFKRASDTTDNGGDDSAPQSKQEEPDMAKKNEAEQATDESVVDPTAPTVESVQAEAEQAASEAAEKIAELTAKVAELEKAAQPVDDTEVIKTADLPEAVVKQIESLEKRAKEAEETAKAERNHRILAEIRKRVESDLPNIGEASETASLLKSITDDCGEEVANKVEELFRAASAQIDQGTLTKNVGHSGDGASSSAQAKLDSIANGLLEKGAVPTREQAIAKALEMNPELYVELRSAAH